ncbi:MAG: DUF4012 domain-containing protein [Aeromicrobium sp.]|uniref:DUF4012 domain-containing protein n=1 Tax=Aeromicrobium sp. TaxID=1871063 RepID=UPI0025BC6EC9|nr:DUF4012 domain-containing protein [Aeromicrobium sp.]MCK5891410.1 DUF4012 domain-containing protein [Aeromicrobium sp.]MDF1704444.1 DUF4012 domain-containing protein [Aeromicrobium sp.]
MLRDVLRPTDWTRRGVLTAVAVVVGLSVAWLAVQATVAVIALTKAADQAAVLRTALVVGDQQTAERALDQLTVLADRAHDSSDGPLWWIAGHVPLVGDEAQAVTTISSGLSVAVHDALPPLMEVADQLEADSFTVRDSVIDPALFTSIAPALAESDAAFAPVVNEVDQIDASSLFGRLRRPVVAAQQQLQEVGGVLSSAHRAADVLPEVLGTSGPRTYLVAVQSNAEIRPLGGVPGTWLLVQADDGRISILETGSSSDLPQLDTPAEALSPQELGLYGTTVATDFRNSMLNPHFPRSAELASAIFAAHRGIQVDGVLAVDPVTLAYLLVGTGPIQASDGSVLTAENTVDRLLNQAYVEYPDGASQNAFFESTARSVFDVFTAGQGDSSTVLRALAEAARERRVLVWLRDPALEEELGNDVIAGRFDPDGGVPTVGVFLSDRTEAKLEYYLSSESTVSATRCEDDQQKLLVRTQLRSTVPTDPASLPLSVTGLAPYAPQGTMVLRVRAYAPSDGSIDTVQLDGQEVPFETQVDGDRLVAYLELDLAPGASRDVRITMTTGPGQTQDGRLLTTPGIRPGTTDVGFASAC